MLFFNPLNALERACHDSNSGRRAILAKKSREKSIQRVGRLRNPKMILIDHCQATIH
jgi:hypothetical protein